MECSFFDNNGFHFVINGKCAVCGVQNEPQIKSGEEITLKNFGELDGSYRVKKVKKGVISLEFLR